MTQKSRSIMLTAIVGVVITLASSCGTPDAQHYTLDDFYTVKKVDGHVHIGSDDPGLVEQAVEDNFVLLSIVTEVPDYPPIVDQESDCIHLMKDYPGRISYLSAFETETINQPDWDKRTLDKLENSFANGAAGIKVWKNIGMVIKDKNDQFIQINDPVFDPVFDYMVARDLPVMGHIGEPRSCWLPIEEMVVNNDRNYFARYPEYHMYLHPENPSYEQLIAARDSVMIKHPTLSFVGAHMGSMEWSIDMIIEHLDRFPNFSVDLTDRICYLQHQSIADWQKVHDFFVDYQDRIMYGTDLETWDSVAADVTRKNAHEVWLRDWEYFTSDKDLTAPAVNGDFKGLKLPKEVIDKIYYRNAMEKYPRMRMGVLSHKDPKGCSLEKQLVSWCPPERSASVRAGLRGKKKSTVRLADVNSKLLNVNDNENKLCVDLRHESGANELRKTGAIGRRPVRQSARV